MNTPSDGGPAFPAAFHPEHGSIDGMTLRDYFAGQAMVGLVHKIEHGVYYKSNAAADAYAIADAMLDERSKQQST